MFPVHSRLEDEACELGLVLGFEIGLFCDNSIDRSFVYGLLCLVDDGAWPRVYLA